MPSAMRIASLSKCLIGSAEERMRGTAVRMRAGIAVRRGNREKGKSPEKLVRKSNAISFSSLPPPS